MRANRDVTFVGFGTAGGAHYRAFLPARGLGAGIVIRHWDTSGDEPVFDVARAEGDPNGDILVYHMPMHDYHVEEIGNAHDQGRKVVVDLDDDLVGVTEYEGHAWAKDIVPLIPNHKQAIREADLVTCSTPWLQNRIAERFPDKEIHLCENGLDTNRYNIRRIKRPKDRFIVGWEGGLGHEGAWDDLAPQVKAFLDRHEDANLFIIGQALPNHFPPGEYEGRIIYHPWRNSMTDYVQAMSFFNVGIAPSLPIDFYKAKSPLRLFEYQALHIPAMCSPTTYGDFIDDTENAMIVNDGEWTDALDWAYENMHEMRKMGTRGFRWLNRNYTIEHTIPQWQAAIDRAREL